MNPYKKEDAMKIKKPEIILYTNDHSNEDIEEVNMTNKQVKERLEYLRGEILAERISYSELHELQELSIFIDKNDIPLLEWAGVPETINY